jgi:ADP-L-glycero-D-manno-heptose 6-epimerase
MIIVTGAGGFIASVIIGYLNSQGIDDIIAVDDLPNERQFLNLVGKKFLKLIKSNEFPENLTGCSAVIHFGAISDTLEKNWSNIYENNVESTRKWNILCQKHKVPLIFASSAAIYGNGKGPLNQYAFSKSIIEAELDSSCVLRLFNVYGPNEYHKGRMASTIYQWFREYSNNQTIELFEHSDRFYRDFIYVEDVAKIVFYFINNFSPGIYDVGTGRPYSFQEVANFFVKTIGNCDVFYKTIPEDLKKQYQTHTCSNVENIRKTGFNVDNLILPQYGIEKYIEYLVTNSYY